MLAFVTALALAAAGAGEAQTLSVVPAASVVRYHVHHKLHASAASTST